MAVLGYMGEVRVMTREELELMAELKRICNQAPGFALAFMAEHLSIEAEETYALRLAGIGERLLAHAKRRKVWVINGEAIQFVIDAELVPVEREVRGLPPGKPGNERS
jgi:hypothetical protein